MHRIVNQIRDLTLIENQLHNSSVGILALYAEDEKTIQFPTTFIYRDKNIFIFFKEDDELYELLKYNSSASFTVIKDEKNKKGRKLDFVPSYVIFSITINGLVRKVDDEKLIQTLRQEYLRKYCKGSEVTEKMIPFLANAIIMDSDEIHAQEEIGG